MVTGCTYNPAVVLFLVSLGELARSDANPMNLVSATSALVLDEKTPRLTSTMRMLEGLSVCLCWEEQATRLTT